MKYLVTGGAGFIGSHLTTALIKHGHEVLVVDNLSSGKAENIPSNCHMIHGDILDKKVLKQAFQGIDGCFHLAAVASVQRSITHWIASHQVNLQGTINVFETAAQKGIPVVYASSAAVYGNAPHSIFVENLLPMPISGYAADKYACELQAKAFGAVFGLPTFGLRLFNVYGPNQSSDSDYSGVISIFINKIQNKQSITIYGDGEQTRDFIFVHDVVNFMLSAMKNVKVSAPIANICTGKGTTINQLAQTLFTILGEVDIHYADAKIGDIFTSIGASSHAERLLNMCAQTSLEEGLNHLVTMV